jgi:hypothetical protein
MKYAFLSVWIDTGDAFNTTRHQVSRALRAARSRSMGNVVKFPGGYLIKDTGKNLIRVKSNFIVSTFSNP